MHAGECTCTLHRQELYDGFTGAWRPRNHTLTNQHATAFPKNVLQKTALYAWKYCFAIRPDYPEIIYIKGKFGVPSFLIVFYKLACLLLKPINWQDPTVIYFQFCCMNTDPKLWFKAKKSLADYTAGLETRNLNSTVITLQR